jgi:hypothetical protein
MLTLRYLIELQLDTLHISDAVTNTATRMSLAQKWFAITNIEPILVALACFSSLVGPLVLAFTLYSIYLILIGKTSIC